MMGNTVSKVCSSGEEITTTDERLPSNSSTTMSTAVSARPTHIPMPPSPFANLNISYTPSPSHRLEDPFESPLLSPALVFYTAPSSPIVDTPTGTVPQSQAQAPVSPPLLPVLHINAPQIIPPSSQFPLHTPPPPPTPTPPTFHPVRHHSPIPHSPPDHVVHPASASITEDSFPENTENLLDDAAYIDESYSTVEKIYLYSRSEFMFQRVFIANALPELLEHVTPREAAEYVLPLLNTLALDDDELVKEAFSSKLVAIIWWFSTHCQLIPEDSAVLNREDSMNPPEFHGHEDVPKITVQAFTPMLGTLLLSPNSIVGGAARYAVVALLQRIRRVDSIESEMYSNVASVHMQAKGRLSLPSESTNVVENDEEETLYIGFFGKAERALLEKEMLYQIVIGMGCLDADSDAGDFVDFDESPPGVNDCVRPAHTEGVNQKPDIQVVVNDDHTLRAPDLDLRIVNSHLYESEEVSPARILNGRAAEQVDNNVNPYFPVLSSPSNALSNHSGKFGSPSSSGSSTSTHSSTTSSSSPDNLYPSSESSPDLADPFSAFTNFKTNHSSPSSSSPSSSSPSSTIVDGSSIRSSPVVSSGTTVSTPQTTCTNSDITPSRESVRSHSLPTERPSPPILAQADGLPSGMLDQDDYASPALRPIIQFSSPSELPMRTNIPPPEPFTSGMAQDDISAHQGHSQEQFQDVEEIEENFDQAAVGRLCSMSLIAAVAASGCLDDVTKNAFVSEVERVSKDSVFWVRREACFALGALAKLVPEEVVQLSLMPIFQTFIADPAFYVRHSSLFALPAILTRLPVRMRRQLALDVMVPMSMDESSQVRAGVLEALGEVIYTFHTEDEQRKRTGHISSDAVESETPPEELLKMFLGRTHDRRIIDGQQSHSLPHSLQGHIREGSLYVAHNRWEALEAFYTDPSRPFICAFSFPAVALTLGRERWTTTLREHYLSLALKNMPGVRRTLAASLGEMAKIIGPTHAQRDLMIVWHKSICHEEEDVRMKAIDCLASFAGALGKETQEEVLRGVLHAWESGSFKGWRERERIAKGLSECIEVVARETWRSIAELEVLSLADTVNTVREAGLYVLPKLWVTFKEHAALDVLHANLEDMARSDSSRRRMTYIACQQVLLLSEEDGPPPVEIDNELCVNLASLASDMIIGVRIGVARLIGAICVDLSRRSRPIRKSLMDVVRVLQQDDSPGVRSYVTNCFVEPWESAEPLSSPGEAQHRIRKITASASIFSRPPPPTQMLSSIAGFPS